MTIKQIIILIVSILLLGIVVGCSVYFLTMVRDEIDITDSARNVFSAFEEKALSGQITELTAKEKKMTEHWSEVEGICLETMERIVNRYGEGRIDESKALSALACFRLFPINSGQFSAYQTETEAITQGRTYYEQALALPETMQTTAALYLSYVSAKDKTLFEAAKAKFSTLMDADALKAMVGEYKAKYQIKEITSFLERIDSFGLLKEEIKTLTKEIEDYQKWQEETVAHKGQIEVLYVRNLMAFPEIVYAPGAKYTETYDSSLITPYEFKKIIESLYQKNYILIDIANLEKDGGLAEISIPSGKKPIVLCVEDLSYASAKEGGGTISKLALDENGKLCSITNGATLYDNESVLILNEFANEHPDFVYKGARGMISLTGYEGLLGYRTGSGQESEIENAKKVVQALKEEGWTFGCQSYSYADMTKASLETLQKDTEKWRSEIGAIVGDTSVYVWPYGSSVRSGEKKEALYNQGFRIFCGVGLSAYRANESNSQGIFVDRKPLSGYNLKNRKDDFAHLFDASEVVDPARTASGSNQ
ncbi:MAG: polysaccharide deacetylase family protein [Clostridiales bacterium]|nr:polysaccharide deacetylase family protein [Clostridiales bacterium]